MDDDKYFRFNKINENVTELYIYGEIRKPDWVEQWLEIDKDLVDSLSIKDALQKVDTPILRVRINSIGGSVSEGLAIYSLLSDFQGELETIVDGFACSAASIIFMAGKKRIVPENGLLMIHNAWMSVAGDHNDLQKAAADLVKITQPSVNIYCLKTGLSEEKIKEMMDEEYWIPSAEAFELNFATTVDRNENAKQSLKENYLYNLVMKNKSLKQELMKVANPLKEEDALTSFLNGRKD